MVNETMSTAEKLAPCPFCGGEAEFRLRSEDLIEEDDYDVQCGTKGCYLEFGGDWFLTKDDAAALWNRRAQPAADGAQRVERMSEEQIEALWVEHGLDEDDPGGFAHAIETHLAAAWGVKLDGEA